MSTISHCSAASPTCSWPAACEVPVPGDARSDASYVARVVAFLRHAQPARAVANALLELGLPRIRAWLREKAGPYADVGEIRIEKEGALVHLDRVRVPLGARGLLVLDHASATIVRGKSGLPEARLEEYRGVLSFGSGRRYRRDALIRAGLIEERGAPGLVRRCRTTSTE